MCVQKIGDGDPTLAKVCETRARSCRMHAGKRKRVCKSEFNTAYTKQRIHVRQLSVMQLTLPCLIACREGEVDLT